MADPTPHSSCPDGWQWRLPVGLLAALATAFVSPPPAAAVPWSSLTTLTDTQNYTLRPTVSVTAVSWLGRTTLPGAVGPTHVALRISNSGPTRVAVAIVAKHESAGTFYSVTGMVPNGTIPVGAGMTVRSDLVADAWSGGGPRGAELNLLPDDTTLGLNPVWSVNFGAPASTGTEQRRVAVITAGLANPDGRSACQRLGWTEDDVRGIVEPAAHGPADWRGWTPLTDIAMTVGDFQSLPAATREALFQWVALGGRATVFGDGQPPAGLPGGGWLGAGSIRFQRTADEGPPPGEPQPVLPADMWPSYGYTRGQDPTALTGADISWSGGFSRLADRFGPRRRPTGLLLAFVTLFGLIAGPINVLLLARPPRRSRIFATTAALSLGATVLLLLLMFLRDGTGGAGIRRTLCLLLPEQTAHGVVQEQFSRTGVLLGSDLPITERSWMRPVGLTHLGKRFVEDGDGRRRGDWFHGRSDQGFVLQSVRSSRGRIAVVDTAADGTPTLISSLDVVLDTVLYRDAAGRTWRTERLPAGVRRPCTEVFDDAWKREVDALGSDAGSVRKRAIDRATAAPGTVIASARDTGVFAIETHRAIRWRDERVDFIGPVTDAAGETPP